MKPLFPTTIKKDKIPLAVGYNVVRLECLFKAGWDSKVCADVRCEPHLQVILHGRVAHSIEVDPGHAIGLGVLAVVELSILSMQRHGLAIVQAVLLSH